MRWDYYADGARLGGVKIIERLNSADRQDEVFYAVRWSCCGREDELTHKQIARRVTRGSAVCRRCMEGAAARRMTAVPREPGSRKRAEPKPPPPPPLPDGVHDLTGRWWPKLTGPMGPRMGF